MKTEMREMGFCPNCRCHLCKEQAMELRIITYKLLLKKMGVTKEMLNTGTVEHWKGKLNGE